VSSTFRTTTMSCVVDSFSTLNEYEPAGSTIPGSVTGPLNVSVFWRLPSAWIVDAAARTANAVTTAIGNDFNLGIRVPPVSVERRLRRKLTVPRSHQPVGTWGLGIGSESWTLTSDTETGDP